MQTTVGQLMVNEILPEKYRDYGRSMGASEVKAVLTRMALENPERYKEVSNKLVMLGAQSSFDEGITISISDTLSPVKDRKEMFEYLRAQKAKIMQTNASPEEKEKAIEALNDKIRMYLTDATYNNGLKSQNPFALQVASKARGSPAQLVSLQTSPGTYTDMHGKQIPIFIEHSFAEGLSPHEYWAGTYGARKSVMCLALDTEVLMGDYSVRKIIDIHPGDMVMGSDANGQMRPVRVVRVYDNGVQPVYRFSFLLGAGRGNYVHVDATKEHRMLARMWKAGGHRGLSPVLGQPELVKLDKAVPNPKCPDHARYVAQLALGAYVPKIGIHNEYALLLGLIAGDGCCSPTCHGNITFSCADQELISDISDYVHSLGVVLNKSKGKNYNWVLKRASDCPISWHMTRDGHKFNSQTRAVVWDVYGGCLSHTKSIPEGIWGWDNESVLAFLAGIIATDGSIYRAKSSKSHSFSFAVNSLQLLVGVKQLLERRFGIFCGAIHEMQRRRKHHMYGFVVAHPLASEKFFRLFENIVPGVKKHILREAHGVLSDRCPRIGCRIAKCEFLENLPVMDIEVDSPDHMFVLANGLVSSNSTKFATRDAGALGKQYNRAVMRLVVADNDCGTTAGIPVKPDDIDNIGSVLSSDAPPYKAGTVVTKEVLQDLKDKYDEILVRSPLTCGCKEGLCAKCAGIRETGKFPEIGSHVGLQASSALAERIAQGSLNCLVEGTMVRMADGTDRRIEDVKKGEIVMGSDLDGNISPTTVVDVFDNGIQPCVETVFGACSGDEMWSVSLCSTSIHKVLGSIGGSLDKFEVGIEGEFWAHCSHSEHGPILLKRLSQVSIGGRHVYDLEVACPDHIFLLANGLIVSNTKHSSGVSQGKGKVDDGDTYAGFDIIDNLFQIPKEFPHRAAVSSVTGNVESVEKAPQGGWNIVVDGKTHYAISETKPRVKVGDYVEAGDQLSTGLMNPADVVRYKGIGEGRRYLMNRATKAYKDSGYAVNRRNMEVLVRGFLDNVKINGNEGVGDFLPDDVVSYSAMASTYKPRQDSTMKSVKDSIGSYLEEPVMHYTIGTKITRNVANQLQRHGHSNIYVNANPPGFEPEATPLKLISRNEKDWVDRLGGTYLKSNILDAAHRGLTSEIHSLQPEHAMARGVELGNPPPAWQFGKKWVY